MAMMIIAQTSLCSLKNCWVFSRNPIIATVIVATSSISTLPKIKIDYDNLRAALTPKALSSDPRKCGISRMKLPTCSQVVVGGKCSGSLRWLKPDPRYIVSVPLSIESGRSALTVASSIWIEVTHLRRRWNPGRMSFFFFIVPSSTFCSANRSSVSIDFPAA